MEFAGANLSTCQSTSPQPAPPRAERRRLLDLAVGGAALVALLPVIAAVGLAVLARLGPPVIFRQTRPGRAMRPFEVLKFRTLRDRRAAPGGGGRELSLAERETGLGRFLRRTRLDELPQLWNVLRGDMALIGPRPLLLEELAEAGEALAVERAAVRPGITGWAQVQGGRRLAAAQKVELDLWYIRHRSARLDLEIACRTAWTVLAGERVGASALARASAS